MLFLIFETFHTKGIDIEKREIIWSWILYFFFISHAHTHSKCLFHRIWCTVHCTVPLFKILTKFCQEIQKLILHLPSLKNLISVDIFILSVQCACKVNIMYIPNPVSVPWVFQNSPYCFTVRNLFFCWGRTWLNTFKILQASVSIYCRIVTKEIQLLPAMSYVMSVMMRMCVRLYLSRISGYQPAPHLSGQRIHCPLFTWCEGEKLIQQINNELGIVHFFRAFYFFLLHLKLSGTKLQKWKQLTLIFEPAS